MKRSLLLAPAVAPVAPTPAPGRQAVDLGVNGARRSLPKVGPDVQFPGFETA